MRQEQRDGKVVLTPVSGGQIRIGEDGRRWADWLGRQAYKYRLASRKAGRTTAARR